MVQPAEARSFLRMSPIVLNSNLGKCQGQDGLGRIGRRNLSAPKREGVGDTSEYLSQTTANKATQDDVVI